MKVQAKLYKSISTSVAVITIVTVPNFTLTTGQASNPVSINKAQTSTCTPVFATKNGVLTGKEYELRIRRLLQEFSTYELKTLTQKITTLEIERAFELTRFTPESPRVQCTERLLKGARAYFTKKNGNIATLNNAVSNALLTRIATAEVELALIETVFTAESPTITTAKEHSRLLKERYAQLQRRAPKATLNAAVSKALKNKIKERLSTKAKLQQRYSINSKEIKKIDFELRSLSKRLAIYQ